MDVFLLLKQESGHITKLAEVLGGICKEEAIADNAIEQHYTFSLESRADQFQSSVRLFPEVASISQSPDLIAQAIANSRLCACGEKTLQGCATECDRNE